jgi:hypothetical protein
VNTLHRNTTLLYLPAMHESRNAALKATEDQVKQLRDDAATQSQTRSLSVRSKISNRVHGKVTRERVIPYGLSDQDIKAALGLVDESWERQEYRLQQYLQRNYDIANGIPVNMEVDDEEFERPDTAASIGKLVEKAVLDTTPTIEKEIQLGTAVHDSRQDATPLEKEIEMSFPHNYGAWARPRLPS